MELLGEPKQTAGLLSSNWCELGAVQLKLKALLSYLGKSPFNLVLTPLETEKPNFSLQRN